MTPEAITIHQSDVGGVWADAWPATALISESLLDAPPNIMSVSDYGRDVRIVVDNGYALYREVPLVDGGQDFCRAYALQESEWTPREAT